MSYLYLHSSDSTVKKKTLLFQHLRLMVILYHLLTTPSLQNYLNVDMGRWWSEERSDEAEVFFGKLGKRVGGISG